MSNSQPDRNKISQIITYIEGWLFDSEAYELAKYASECTENIVEIGSFRGRSTIVMATYASVPVYAIDPHIPSKEENTHFNNLDRVIFTANLIQWGVAHKVKPIDSPSQEVAKTWDKPIGLLFVDGSHDYEQVKADLDGFIPHVVEGGILATHDKNLPGVIKAVSERDDLRLIQTKNITNFYEVRRF